MQVGLIVNLRQPWLCASPDGLLKDGDETVLLEIKCPFSRKDSVLIDVDNEISFVTYIFYEGGKLKLKRRHQYYTQVQVAMYVTNTSRCFFFVYSSVQSIVIVVQRDEAFLAQSVPVLEHFYFSFYIKELLHA